MTENIEGGDSKDSDIPAFIIGTLLLAVLLLPILLSFSWRQQVALTCDGNAGSPSVREIKGPLEKFQSSYLIPGEKGNWIVLACSGKGGCLHPLKKRYDAALGKIVHAGYCRNELLWVDIDEERVFTRDGSYSVLPLFFMGFLVPIGIVFLARYALSGKAG